MDFWLRPLGLESLGGSLGNLKRGSFSVLRELLQQWFSSGWSMDHWWTIVPFWAVLRILVLGVFRTRIDSVVCVYSESVGQQFSPRRRWSWLLLSLGFFVDTW